ncbi:MAG: hypothetical protein AAB396_00730 [Patescibacteria group bacterium]
MINKDKKIKVVDIVAKPEKIQLLKSEEKTEIKKERESFFETNNQINQYKEEVAAEEENTKTEEVNFNDKKTEEDFLKDDGIKETLSIKTKIKKYFLIFVLLVILSGIGYSVVVVLPRVNIKITTKKTSWKITESVITSKNFGGIDTINKQIPASFFSEKKNISLSFPASGRKSVEKKSGGEIIIYNTYSSDAQTLIKGTRFAALDGKIFNLDSKIIVPGAKIEEGKVIPSLIKARVAAEKAGDEYNIGPIDKFFIPGFKGSAKYNGFYAKSESNMVGGFVGEEAYPTDEDIKSAKLKIAKSLEEILLTIILSQIPKDFKIIEEAKQFSIVKDDVGKKVDANGNFSAFLEGELSIIAFKEKDLFELIDNLANQFFGILKGEGEKLKFEAKERKLDYGAARADFTSGRLSFAFDYEGVYWQPIDVENFKKSIFSNRENELKTIIFSIPGIEKATVSFWPFWVKSVPDNVNKIKVAVE